MTYTTSNRIRKARKQLLDGVSSIAGGVLDQLALFELEAFPVVAFSEDGEFFATVVAAAQTDNNRIIAFGHGSYFEQDLLDIADTGQLLINSIKWVSGKDEPNIGVYAKDYLSSYLEENDLCVQRIESKISAEDLENIDVLVVNATELSSKELLRVKQFMLKGGGLVTADTGWGWQQLNPDKSLLNDNPTNQLLASAGIASTTEVAFAESGIDIVDEFPETLNSVAAFEFLSNATDNEPKEILQARRSLTNLLPVLPKDNNSLLPLLEKLKSQAKEFIPTENNPFSILENPLISLGILLNHKELINTDIQEITAHPASKDFPGKVSKSAERISKEIQFEITNPDSTKWKSTGLYAAAGEKINIYIHSEEIINQDFAIRIGAHSDSLWDAEENSWQRMPEIDRIFPIQQQKMIVANANAFGGLIYVVVPEATEVTEVSLTIEGAVACPYFVLGETDLAMWQEEIRNYSAPWAELEGKSLILTVESSKIRDLDDPITLLKRWDSIQVANRKLAAWPKGKNRPMRIVFDRQISCGYMHAGYPICCLLESQDAALAFGDCPAEYQPKDYWGFFHELGHNHQSDDWTFSGTGEVTVNLFTLHALETEFQLTVESKNFKKLHEGLGDARKKSLETHIAFEEWDEDPFFVLMMYVDLIQEFGWESFSQVFKEYLGLSDDEKPQTDDEKRDQWLVRYSKTVGRNLSEFFDAWQVPISEQAKEEISDLPSWMPEIYG